MKKCITHIVLLFVLSFTAINVNAAQQNNDAVIKQKISVAASQLKSMECDFVQTKTLKMLNEKMVSRGKLYYQRTDKLRWEYTTPYQYTFVINGSQVLIKKGQRSDKINVNQSKVFKEVARIMMNSVLGKSLTDTRDFKSSITTTSTEWVATLTPLRNDMKKMFKNITLHFNKQNSMVTKVILSEQNGDVTVIELKNSKNNATIPASTFSVN